MATAFENVNPETLKKLWKSKKKTKSDVARDLGITRTQLEKLIVKYELKHRTIPKRKRCRMIDPTPEEIAERALECKMRHLAAKRDEKPTKLQAAYSATEDYDDF